MTLKELKETTLKLIDEKPSSTLLNRLMTFFNIGQFEMATTCAFITKSVEIDHTGAYGSYTMPEDFYMATALKLVKDNKEYAAKNFVWEQNTLHLTDEGLYRIYYRAYPTPITELTSDSFSLELPTAIQNALAFYAAAQYAVTDEREKYPQFLKEYQNRLLNFIATERAGKAVNINLQGAVYGI